MSPLVDSVIEGYNATVFAYGSTGSGKTLLAETLAEDLEVGLDRQLHQSGVIIQQLQLLHVELAQYIVAKRLHGVANSGICARHRETGQGAAHRHLGSLARCHAEPHKHQDRDRNLAQAWRGAQRLLLCDETPPGLARWAEKIRQGLGRERPRRGRCGHSCPTQ